MMRSYVPHESGFGIRLVIETIKSNTTKLLTGIITKEKKSV